MPLADRYHELLGFRRDALRRYGANETSMLGGPPARAYFPIPKYGDGTTRARRLGPLTILDRPPLWRIIERLPMPQTRPINVLEIGPGSGDLCAYLRARSRPQVGAYFGIERDRNVRGPYERVENIREIRASIDLAIASEVIEHMSADDFHDGILTELTAVLSSTATFVLSTPNPTAPGGIARDFTHLQNYPWYDLYAILRLHFEQVEIHRAFYAWSAQRIAFLVPRVMLCPMLELDWCDGLIAVATRPRQATPLGASNNS